MALRDVCKLQGSERGGFTIACCVTQRPIESTIDASSIHIVLTEASLTLSYVRSPPTSQEHS